MTKAKPLYIAYGLWGLYGFSRGWQAEPGHRTLQSTWIKDEKRTPILFSDRFTNGLTNAVLYLTPLLNVIALKNTLDRIEIALTNKNPYDYPNSYKELLSYDYFTWPKE